jgi:hypothetical protein
MLLAAENWATESLSRVSKMDVAPDYLANRRLTHYLILGVS